MMYVMCFNCDITGWFCNKCEKNVCKSCENIHFCNIYETELCNFCEKVCDCEKNISRTSSRNINNKSKEICDKECFENLINCGDCNKIYCMHHDYTSYCNECDKYYCTDCRDSTW